MPTIAIVGAGPGLGLALARKFGRQGFSAALIARNVEKLDGMVTELAADGVTAARFLADTANVEDVAAALRAAREHFGSIDVLEFSPYAAGPASMVNPAEVSVENLRPVIDAMLFGAVTAVQEVLPAMREVGTGTILLTAGIGSINPVPYFGTLNTAQAATRNWALNLHSQLTDTDIYLAHIAIGTAIGDKPPVPGYPFMTPDEIAAAYWELHTTRTEPELVLV